MAERFKTLVDMQQRACRMYARNRVFGSKHSGSYRFITYEQFDRLVERFAGALAALGVGPGDKVAVIANNRVEWAVGAYASFRLSAQYVPMYEAQKPEEWSFILRDCGAKVLLAATPQIFAAVEPLRESLPHLEHVLCFDASPELPHSYAYHLELGGNQPRAASKSKPSPADVACIIYTSGTTGNPKGVVLSHANIVSNVNACRQLFPISQDDISCSFLPWAHSFGQTAELHLLMSFGATIGIAESVNTLMDNFQELRPTILLAVPRIFNRIYDGLQKRMAEEKPLRRKLFERGLAVASARREAAERGERSLVLEAQLAVFERIIFSKVKQRFGGRLRFAVSGGAALSLDVAEFIDNIGIIVFEGYGLTETSPVATANGPDARRLGTVGRALPGVEIYICDENGHPLPDGEEGEVVVVGPNVMEGYYDRPEETNAVIFELDGMRAFRTGDLGRKSRDGFLTLTGRIKEQYKLETGKYVAPSPVEEQLKLSGYISHVFLYGDNRPYNVCLVVPDVEAAQKFLGRTEPLPALVTDQRLHEKIGQELAAFGERLKGFERPVRWALLDEEFSVDNGMLTPKMSVRRKVVVERYREVLESLYRQP